MSASIIELERLSELVTGCEKELIHQPGSIQPHGVMLVAEHASQIVRHCAGDVEGLLSIDDWLGRPLIDLLGEKVAQRAASVLPGMKRSLIGVLSPMADDPVDVTAHISGRHLIVELEPRRAATLTSTEALGQLDLACEVLDAGKTLQSLCEAAACEFRRLTNFDRVMVYQFLEGGAGAVIAEACQPNMSRFINHRFPASDIPQQARDLYRRNLVRVIPEVGYTPAPLRPAWGAETPLDMSDSILRSVSPVHLQYLRNMGVTASASISIVADDMLWGLIACHNNSPKTISYDVCAACRSLAGELSRQIRTRREAESYKEGLRLSGSHDEIVSLLSQNGSIDETLSHHLDEMRELFSADGFAVIRGGDLWKTGACPDDEGIRAIAHWLFAKSLETVFATDQLPHNLPAAERHKASASGVMAVVLSREDGWLLIWFRAEQPETINWAGDPHKETVLLPGEILTPRSSFDAWQQIVLGRSRPWTVAEFEGARRMRHALTTAKHTRRTKALNRELLKTVAEKEALLVQKQFLIGEVNHRVQNSLQLVSSFLSGQARDAADASFSLAIEEARRRITAVSLLHRKLYGGGEPGATDAGRYIEDLASSLVASMGTEWADHITLRLAPVMLPVDRVIPLGLIVTELVININKYAYDGRPGPVAITLIEAPRAFTLTVADRGHGQASAKTGFGTRMMSALVTQLGGTIEFEDNEPGVRALLSAPTT